MADLPCDLAGFAEGWIAAWNSHDLDRVLALFDEEAVFTSPLALRVCPESHGVVIAGQGTYPVQAQARP